jgi:predicted XRE-type DNA-binding protein
MMAKTHKTLAEMAEEIERDPARAARIAEHKARFEHLMALDELRRGQTVTQQQVAEVLHVSQERVSQIERQNDLLLSTLRDYITALGGELCVVAAFDGEEIPLQFA